MQRETRYVCGHLAVSCMERQNQSVTVWTHSISYVKACTPKLGHHYAFQQISNPVLIPSV